jgi:hypothetical protein
MKRIIAMALIGTFAAAMAFADIDLGSGFSMSGWGTARVVPLSIMDGKGNAGFYWGKLALTTAWKHEAGKIGIQFEGYVDGDGQFNGSWGVSDNAKIWVKPFDMLKLTYGKFLEDDFRGKFAGSDDDVIGAGDAFGATTTGGYNGDFVFSRFQVKTGTGLHLLLNPIEALKIAAAVDVANGYRGGGRGNLEDVYGTIQVAVGYTIPDIGFARIQFLSGQTEDSLNPLGHTGTSANYPRKTTLYTNANNYLVSNNVHRIEGAFRLTAVENLGLDFGFKIPIGHETTMSGADAKIQQDYLIAVFGNYKLSDALGLDFQLITSFAGHLDKDMGGSTKTYYKNPFALYIFVQPVYKLSDDLNVGGHIAMKMTTATQTYDGATDGLKKDEDSDTLTVTIIPWIQQQLGGGSIKLGLGLNIPAGGAQKDVEYVSFFIPLTFTYSF